MDEADQAKFDALYDFVSEISSALLVVISQIDMNPTFGYNTELRSIQSQLCRAEYELSNTLFEINKVSE